MKLKLPSLPKLRWPRVKARPVPRRTPTRYNASARRAAPPAIDDYEEEEQPTTRLSSAFIVVLVLHVVAVGGIYAFNSIKAHRKSHELAAHPGDKPAVEKPAVQARDESPSAPVAATTSSGTSRAVAPAAAAPVSSGRTYRAHGGETVAKVAAQQGVNASDLAEVNGISQSTVLKAGQVLNIPQPRPSASKTASTANDAKKAEFLMRKEDQAFLTKATPAPKAAEPSGKTYTVARGDTVYSLARKFGVTPEALMKLNKIEDSKKLQIAQVLKVPAKKSE